jgi:hypothetical protein
VSLLPSELFVNIFARVHLETVGLLRKRNILNGVVAFGLMVGPGIHLGEIDGLSNIEGYQIS